MSCYLGICWASCSSTIRHPIEGALVHLHQLCNITCSCFYDHFRSCSTVILWFLVKELSRRRSKSFSIIHSHFLTLHIAVCFPHRKHHSSSSKKTKSSHKHSKSKHRHKEKKTSSNKDDLETSSTDSESSADSSELSDEDVKESKSKHHHKHHQKHGDDSHKRQHKKLHKKSRKHSSEWHAWNWDLCLFC